MVKNIFETKINIEEFFRKYIQLC